MMPTAELLVMETTRSAACPKQLSTKRNRREGKSRTGFRSSYFMRAFTDNYQWLEYWFWYFESKRA